jgi:pyruvate carboxylase subunit B
MKKNNWDLGPDDEELFELAMHPEQYRAYKSGQAKADFEADLAKRRAEEQKANAPAVPVADSLSAGFQPKTMHVNVNGEKYVVSVSYGDGNGHNSQEPVAVTPVVKEQSAPVTGAVKEVIAPLEGKFFLTKDPSEKAVKLGDMVKQGDTVAYIESMKTFNAIMAEASGKVVEICLNNGDSVDEDDVIIKLQ